MLELDNTLWDELIHAYGRASDIPAVLEQLRELPPDQGDGELWDTLWSSLAHQGDVYQASFAAVPHIIDILAEHPIQAHWVYFQFPAWVEICRIEQDISVCDVLAQAYFQSLERLPALIGKTFIKKWDESHLLCALSALAACKGNTAVAHAIMEMTGDVPTDFLNWFFEQ